MRELNYNKAVYPSKLHVELNAALGEAKVIGVATGPGPCIVRLVDTTVPADDAVVDSVVAAHDATPPPDPLVVDLTQARSQAGANPLDGLSVTAALSWIDANVVDLPSARTALKQLVKIAAIQERRLRIIERRLGL